MNESKIDLTERLRREGRWAEASKFKDETVKKLRAEGMKRAEAGEQAWQKVAEAYPPLPSAEPIPEPAADDDEAVKDEEPADDEEEVEDELDEMLDRVWYAAESAVGRWQQKCGVTLADDARSGLIEEVASCGAGWRQELPG